MLLGGLLPGDDARGAPKPALAIKTWQLDFAFDDPQRITITPPGERTSTTYWYMLFTVTNNTGKDVKFLPTFRLLTNQLEKVDGGDGVTPYVYDEIFKRHRPQYPFITEPFRATGMLLQGRENARTSAVVFKSFNPQADKFTIYVSGLSGDVERQVNPAFDVGRPEKDDNRKYFLLRRTLAVEYDLPGDARSRSTVQPVRRSRRWEMR
jgi:hypothetical protein